MKPLGEKFLAGAVQFTADLDKQQNLAAATDLIAQAVAAGARLVVLPEFANRLGPLAEVFAGAEPIPGPTSAAYAELARQHAIWLVGGTICELSTQPDRGYNTCVVFDPAGNIAIMYRKLHLFDVELPAQSLRESDWIIPGDAARVLPLQNCRIGLATCYDLRFPELFRMLAEMGMDILAFPSAFLQSTGQAHWEVLLRARAIENQCFVVAANQVGRHADTISTFGHSQIINPWGEVLADAGGESSGVAIAEIDLAQVQAVRSRIPALTHRREFCRGAPEDR